MVLFSMSKEGEKNKNNNLSSNLFKIWTDATIVPVTNLLNRNAFKKMKVIETF